MLRNTPLTFSDTTPTPNTAWTVNQLGEKYLSPVGTSGNGEDMIVTATTNHLGNPEFTLINPGLGYQVGDTVLFYDPEFVIYGGGQTIPSAELVVSAQEKPKFIKNEQVKIFKSDDHNCDEYITRIYIT